MKAFVQQTMKVPYDIFFVKNYRKFLWMLLKFGSTKRFSEKEISFNGFQFTVPDAYSFVWQYKEILVDRCYDFKTNETQPIIYDCGANVGLASLFFAKQFPSAKIKAFEADKNISVLTKKNLARNNVRNVEVINKAVWINDKQLNFGSEGADGGSLMNAEGNTQLVQAIRLRDLLEKENRIDMLKMDIEGAETEVILDCENSLGHIQNMFLEYHSYASGQQKLSDILGIFKKNGFRYLIENVHKPKLPFLNKGEGKTMDMQLNIYAYRS